MEPLINQVLHDRYRIQSLLGRQTGRRTFLATDSQIERAVVVKLLLFGPDFSWDDLKLFEREVEVLKSLDHPAIPKYLDYFEVATELGKGFALVQTYIEARSLQSWIQAGRTFSEAEFKDIARQLLEILDYLHNRHPAVIHRDLKPSNILLSDRTAHRVGQVYLIDFGSVQTVAHGGTRTVVGTYGYMPPEQFGGRTTPASDLYALGATLIYLVTGHHPDQLPQKDMQIAFEDQVNLPVPLIDWLKWMTAPSVEKRLKSAKQALNALEANQLVLQDDQQESALVIVPKPQGSKVKINTTRKALEIIIPPRGFHAGLIPIIGFAIAWNSFLVMWYGIAFATWSSGGWFAALFAICHLGIGLGLIWSILFTLTGQVKLFITQQTISLTHEIFGLRCSFTQTATRQSILQLERTRSSYKRDSDGDPVAVPPQINIWAGTKKFQLGDGGRLTEPELDWLAYEISRWLKLPVKDN